MGNEFNGNIATKIKLLRTVDGYSLTDVFIDYREVAPPGFIVVRPVTEVEGRPYLFKLVKVANISVMEMEEGELGKLWGQFNPLPEQIKTKQS